MHGAEVVLAVNIAVASLFAGAYAMLAFAYRTQRRALWFSVSYLIGMVSPASDFLVPLSDATTLLEWLSYSSFLLACLSVSFSLPLFYGRRPRWEAIGAIFALGVGLRILIWNWSWASAAHSFLYQLPFALAALLACHTVLNLPDRRGTHIGLAAAFTVMAAHFMLKPFLAVSFGKGLSAKAYTSTTYALLSQASTGVLLLASGLLVLLIVAHRAIGEAQLASQTDPLSGLLNRRGFDGQANAVLARADRTGRPVSAALFDLDHFKRINDTFGHDAGDRVIADFAALLRASAPPAAIIGRMGGEEFAMLIDCAEADQARRTAEVIRLAAARAASGDRPAATASAGVAQRHEGEALSDLMRRADQASYRAKNNGRNRVCLAEEVDHDDGETVRALRRA